MSTNLQRDPPPAIKEHTSANRAPLKPLMDLQRGNVRTESTLQAALKERFKTHLNQGKRTFDEMNSLGYQVAMFIEGKQNIRPNPFPGAEGQWIAYTPKNDATRKRTMNLMRFYSTNALYKWQLSNPDIIAVPGVDTEEARESAQAADIIIEHYERKFFKPFLTIQEGLHGLCWGTYLWRVRYDQSLYSMTALQPIMGITPVTLGEGYGVCPSCGYEGPATTMFTPVPDINTGLTSYICNHCGNPADVDPPATADVPSVVGQQEHRLGDLCVDLLPFPECRWDLRHRAEDSSWFIHQRRTNMTAIRRLLGPDFRLPGGGEGMNDLGLDVIDRLAWAAMGQTPGERKLHLYDEPVNIVEYSLGPDDIADIVLRADEETIDGGVIPAGPLINTYPRGFTAQGLNGFNVLTGVFDERHRDCITQGVWHSKALSGTGQGFGDTMEVQKRYNADDSQIHTFLRATSTPAMLVRREVLGEVDPGYLGDPEVNIPIYSQNLPDGVNLEDTVRPAFQPQSVPSQFFNYVYQRLNDLAQLTSHVTDFSGGLPNVNNRTATGAQITQANSNALFTPPLQIKGEIRMRIAEIVIELYRTHFPVDRYFPLKGRYGRQQGRYLSAANISTEIAFEVVKDSELPRNMFTKREDYSAFFLMFGGAKGYVEMRNLYPELVIEVERSFNIQMNSEVYDQVASLCQQRVTQLRQGAQMMLPPDALVGVVTAISPLGMPTLIGTGMGVIQPPVVLEEPAHDLHAKWLSDWLAGDEGQSAPLPHRAAVQLLIRYHFQLDGEQKRELAFSEGAVMASAQLPQALNQAVNNEVNPTPDVNNDVPDVNHPGKTTGRPRPKSKK